MQAVVLKLEEKDAKKWDNYVYANAFSSFFQLSGWKKVIEDSFGCQTCYLVALEKDDIKGILPLFIVKSRILGNSVSSLPGGICADNKEAAKLLFEKATRISKEEKANCLKIRDSLKKWNFDSKILIYNTSILSLTKDPNDLWKSFDTKARNQTRKATKAGLKTAIGKNNLEEFYQVFSINMRDLGTPVFPYEFFERIISEFPEETNLLTVKYENKVIGGMFLFFFKDTIFDPWASSLRKFFSYCPNNILYWEAFKYGCNNGFRFFDMGRSQKDSGTFKFKNQWGAYSKEIYYQYYKSGYQNYRKIEEDTSKYSFLPNIWKKLPVAITNLLGPSLRKKVPFG